MEKLQELYVRAINEVSYALERRKGQGMVEYALILVLVSIVAIAALTLMGGNVRNIFNRIQQALTFTT